MRRRKRRTTCRSGSGVTDDGLDDNDLSDGDDMPCETDAMTFLEPYVSIKRSSSNMVRIFI